MRYGKCKDKTGVAAKTLLSAAVLLLAVLLGLPATAESPGDAKRIAFEAIDKNAEQIATVGDVLYYFGEPGMQEYESAKYLKETLDQIGLK
jgi:hypothetical protein